MFCSRCGLRVEEGNRFCQACGQEVGGAVIVAPIPSATVAGPVSASISAPASLPYGGFWERVGAYLIDGLILGIPFGAVVMVLIITFGGFGVLLHRRAADPSAAMALVAPVFMIFFLGMLGFLILQWLYFAGMESSERQATFGKSVMSLRVTNYEGSAHFVRPCDGTILRKNCKRHGAAGAWVHHGRIHGEKAGASRFHRWDAGAEEIKLR